MNKKLSSLLRDLGISKVKLAKFLGVSRQMIYNYLELDDLNKWPKDKKILLFNLLGIKKADEIDKIVVNTDYILQVESKLDSITQDKNDSKENCQSVDLMNGAGEVVTKNINFLSSVSSLPLKGEVIYWQEIQFEDGSVLQNENAKDIEDAKQSNLPAPLLKRLSFGEEKLRSVVQGLRDLAALPDPLGHTTLARELTEGSRSMENATAQWLRSVSETERREFVDARFRVLETSESNKIGPEMLVGFLKNPAALTGAIRRMSPQVWQNLLHLLQALISPNQK